MYYLHGADDFLKENAVRTLIEGAVDPATRDFNLESRKAGEVDAAALSSVLDTPPMMSDRRVVVLRDTGALKKDVRAALLQYLARPASDTVLVLVATAGSKADGELEKAGMSVAFDALEGDRVAKWILHYASTELGLEMTPAAAERLHALAGEDLRELASELGKLAALSAHRVATGSAAVIDDAAVDEIVGVRRGETLGDLLDFVADRNAAGALRIVEHVLSQPKASGVTTIMALSAQTLAIGWAVAALAEGLPRHRLEQELYGLLRAKSPFTGRAWGEAVKAYARGATSGKWSRDAIDESLEALLAADVALKWSGVSSEEQVVSSTILAMCAAGTRRRAA